MNSWRSNQAAERPAPSSSRALRSTRIVLVEDGAHWPLLASARPIETMVIAQSGDDYETFIARAKRKLQSLSGGDRSIRAAIIAVGDARDEPLRVGGRAEIARTLAKHMQHTGGGEIVLFSQPGTPGDSRSALVGLADGLLAELGTDDVSISLRFGPAKPAGLLGQARLRRVLP